MTSYSVGQKVELNDGRVARIRFLGTTSFQTGEWLGLELDEPTGKNDGSVKGERYFECEQGHGMFVRAAGVRGVLEEAPKQVKRTSAVNGTAGIKSRPSSVHAAVNGVKKADSVARRTSTISASPTPGARSRLSGIRSPTKSPIKQLGSNGPSSTATSRTSTPSLPAAKKPTTAAVRSRPSIAPARAPPTRTTRTSLAPATAAKTPVRPATVRPPATHSLQTTAEEPGDEAGESSNASRSDAEDSENATEVQPRNFAPPPAAPDAASKPAERRASSPSASIHSQRTVRGAAVSSRHVEELEAKIRLLGRKRLEDRDIKKSLEQAQQDREKYQGIIEKLQKKYQPQQQEITELKKALAEAQLGGAAVEDLKAEHESIMEMATLDKEMAEETAEALKAELDALRSRQEEMELELDLLREENAEFSKDMSPEERAGAGWLQLEKENERLRNALLRLRDLTQDREEDLKTELSELQGQLKDFERISLQLEETRQQLAKSEGVTENLRQQLEAALGAEEMIEELTERNMGLTERIDELKAVIEDLENLRELNDELEVNHIEAEKQMQEEIDFKDALVQDRDRLAKQQQSALDDAEYTITRFRELVTQLQSDLQDMQASKQITESEAAELESKSRAMLDLNLRLQSSAAKTKVKTIDLELRKMEADEASQHLEIVQLFLPSSFQAEHDSVLALLRFKRINFKAALLQTFMRERMLGSHGTADNVFASAEVHDYLAWIAGTSDRFVKAMNMCTTEEFARYDAVQYDLEPVERALNVYIDALRRDDIKEEPMADELHRSIAVLSHLVETHIGNGLATHGDELDSRIVYLQNQLEGIAAAFAGIKAIIESNTKPAHEEGNSEYHDDNGYSFITVRADGLVTQTRSIKVILNKSLKALMELHEKNMTLDPDCVNILTTAEVSCQAIAQYTRTAGQALRNLYSEEGRVEAITSEEVARAIMNVATEAFDLPAQEAGPFTSVMGQLRALSDSVSDVAALANDLDNTVEFQRAAAPWTTKAEQMKEHKRTAHDTEAELARATENLREKDATVRAKDSELEEQSVRIEMLEARMREASKRSARIVELERALQDARDNEKRAKQDLEKTRRDASHELDNVRDELSRAAKRGQHSRQGSYVDANAIGPGTQLAMKKQEHQIVTLQAALRFLKEENTRLRMPTTSAPRVVAQSMAWLHEPLLKPQTEKRQHQATLHRSGMDVLSSLREIVLASGSVDLSTIPENKLAWRPAKMSSRWQVETRKEQWANWRQWRDEFVKDAALMKTAVK